MLTRPRREWVAIGAAAAVPAALSAMLVPFRMNFRAVDLALVLVGVVVLAAFAGDRAAGLTSVASSVLSFTFFLLQPIHTLEVTSPGDGETLLLLLGVGLGVSEAAVRGRRQRERAVTARRRLQMLHDASMNIGTTLDMRQTAQELVSVAVPRLADYVTVDLTVQVARGEEPPPDSDIKLIRVASGGISEDGPLCPVGTRLTPAALGLANGDAPGVGHPRLIPDLRTSDGWQAGPEQAARILDYGMHSLIMVPLKAGGALLGVASFWRSRQPGPFQPDELAEASELAARACVAIDNGRRYAGDRATALTLQRNLLPRRLNGMPAAEVASRYLPADSRAGVGGDWFDVIPLSGTRIALVVGDVVGHGIQASATMGRLRTAVRTLADVDLPPAELLDHLDDVVARLASDGQPDSSDDSAAGGGLGVTCLYAVYDPIARQCTLATAGHPLPILVTPDGATELVSDRIGPPLGIGGLPFEAITLELAEGTVLALFTDGLIESRERDIDQGLSELRGILSRPSESLEAAGDAVIDAMLDGRPADDAALLLVRTHALPADRVATWDIPADPAMVTRARQLAAGQLAAWGLSDAEFTTELVVSELVTNAIRHGAPPIQLRLIRDHSLICEVSDSSSTAPHLRRSRAFDEGGRGLMLVSQLTQSWGARQTLTGKTIWCHQPLPDA